MLFSSQLLNRTSNPARRAPHRPASPRFRPRLEVLEDRCMPSTLTVTNPGDDVNVAGTLRYDVAHAQSGDTILITPALHGAPIVLTQGELLLTQNVTIVGLPNNPETISGGGASRVFEVASGAQVSLSNLILTDGDGVASPTRSDPNDGGGGALLIDSGATLTVRDSTLSGNSATFGGGVFNFGTLTVRDSTLCGNSASIHGGAVDNEGTVSVNNSVLSDNFGGTQGGGTIFNFFGMVNVSDSLLSGNSVVGFLGFGGAIYNLGFGTVTVSDSILSDNSVTRGGGAIFNNLGSLAVSNSLLFNNSAGIFGGGILNGRGSLTLSNSLLSGNTAANGGAIVNSGTLTVSNSTLSGNSAADGGAILNGFHSLIGVMTVSNSLLSGNTAANGGAIYNDSGSTMTVTSSQLSDNTASIDGGAIFNNLGTVTIENSSSITGNTASVLGGDVYNLGVLYLDSTSLIGGLDGNPAVPI